MLKKFLRLQMEKTLIIPAADDFHVHLRQGDLLKNVVPLVISGGAARVMVMPNTTPPVYTSLDAADYKSELQKSAPQTEFLMTMYLKSTLTETEIKAAKNNGVLALKLYPKGVTTNSEEGVSGFEDLYPVFENMQEYGLVLSIHGELPYDTGQNICVMNAEEKFLPYLTKLHKDFPSLKIVLEHVSSKAAVDFIKNSGPEVAATITPHHLELTVDDWARNFHNYCKPVAKYPEDREALRQVVIEGNSKFFLGSDSAPHLKSKKDIAKPAAGIFTTPLLMVYLADTFDRLGCLDKLKDFSSTFGRTFYDLPENKKTIKLIKEEQVVPDEYNGIVPFRAGEILSFRIEVDV
ncbi:MAG: dihydroorotase [Spirochaetes bacterium]|nr:dihydroorotase [Spirochaetota bacterium]